MRAYLAVAVITGAVGAAHAREDGAHGYWLVEKGDAIVEAGPCPAALGEGDLCAQVVWFQDDEGQVNPPLAADTRNTEEDLQDRPICGLPILWGLKAHSKKDVYKTGFVYDAFVGETYRVNVRLDGPQLRVRGYLGTPAIGRTERWVRPEAPFERCDSHEG